MLFWMCFAFQTSIFLLVKGLPQKTQRWALLPRGKTQFFLDGLSSFFWQVGARGDVQGNSTTIRAESLAIHSTFLRPLPIHYLNLFIQLLRVGRKVFYIIKWMTKPRLRFRSVTGRGGHSFRWDLPRHPSCLPRSEATQRICFVPFLLHLSSAVTSQSPHTSHSVIVLRKF